MTEQKPFDIDANNPWRHDSVPPPTAKVRLSFKNESWAFVRQAACDDPLSAADMLVLLRCLRGVACNDRTQLFEAGDPVDVPSWSRRKELDVIRWLVRVLDRWAWRLAVLRYRMLGLTKQSGRDGLR